MKPSSTAIAPLRSLRNLRSRRLVFLGNAGIGKSLALAMF
jgi:hypothetical protein